MNNRVVSGLAIGLVFVVAGTASTGMAQSPAGMASSYMTPTIMSPTCQSDAQRTEACQVIGRFFRAVNSGRFATACSLLGEQLRSESHGMSCPRFLALASPEPMPWGILGARPQRSGVSVLVTLGQSELDHIRMRVHRAYVGVEDGRLRILATTLEG